MSTKSIANAVGGRTARACDSCVQKRARWYCPADDAFLCQSCDSAVHSANLLSRRHHRLRLNLSSVTKPPSWITRKPRTPRRPRPPKSDHLLVTLVPDADDEQPTSQLDHDDHLLFQVPTFDPDFGLDEFSADVDSLLGRNLESELSFFEMEGIGLHRIGILDKLDVKVEDGGGGHEINYNYQLLEGSADHHDCRFEAEVDLMKSQPFDFNFEHEDEKMITVLDVKNETQDESMKKRKVGLRLDCDAVIATWGNDKSPFTTGERPHFDFHDSWPHCMAICGVSHRHMCVEYGSGATTTVGDGGREARVLRYKEKRQTRLFSKKIRYEVRKLNAEKRPRMKGRFVKRTSFTQPTLPITNY